MSRIVNSNDEILFATDQECADRRQALIEAGILIPANEDDIVVRKDGTFVVSTKVARSEERQKLVNSGIIDPNLCQLFPEKNRPICTSEEGEYKSRPIKTEAEYIRRKSAYFRMMQEILFSRRELNLVLAKKEESDPDWYF